MALSDQQVETLIRNLQTLTSLQGVALNQASATINSLQTQVNNLNTQVNSLQPVTQSSSGIDTYISGTTIIHKLMTIFQGIVKFVQSPEFASLTAHGVVISEASGQIVTIGLGTSTQVLTSNGASADPSFQSLPALPVVGPGAATYTVGAKLTAITGNNGTITLDANGRVTAVQQAT